jgi:3-hydroxyisobutyrate dehydrogenase-like beta-hydroxyacid dehydrogenase
MSAVTVIGLGVMGAAIARALLDSEYDTTVWNRTISKAAPLVARGATLAPDPAAAVRASPVVLVCVRDHPATRDILSASEVLPHLPGKVVVQLSGGTPQQARESERWILDSGAAYLDGEIMVYPDQIGTPDGTILVAGPETIFQRCEPLLRSVAGRIIHVGEPIGGANAYGVAMGAVLYGALLGAVHGARVCEVEGVSVGLFARMMADGDLATISAAVLDLLDRIAAERYGESQGTLGTGADGAEQMEEHARATGIDSEFAGCVAAVFRRGVEAGLGGEDPAALIKLLRR